MKAKLSNVKTTVMGIQGSGKTELAKQLTKQFKKPVWYLVNLDDLDNMPNHVAVIKAERRNLEELEIIIGRLLQLAKQGKVDAIFIDEFDMFLNTNHDINNYPNINDLVINHRHYKLAVIGITRRPQDIPTKYIESCEHMFVFALPNSDNTHRKFKSMDKDFEILLTQLTKDNHKFIYKQLGYKPQLMNPIKLIKSKQEVKHG